ncbi:MAG: hypothetical protein U9Q33_07200 [Campylobacterota bacterium]|nr:hypothetical protein [Campylobacterota bacterium]
MNTQIDILNYNSMEERTFNLPFDLNEVEEFTLCGKDEHSITNIEDSYNFFMKLEAFNYGNYENISQLAELIENSSNPKETITKILFHTENIGYCNIEKFVNNFDSIVEKYEVFENTTPAIWIKNHNEEYKFIDTTNTQNLSHNFDRDNQEGYIKDLVATYGIEEELSDKLNDMDLSTLLDTVEEMGLLNNSMVSIENYLDWDKLIKNLRASGFYIGHL